MSESPDSSGTRSPLGRLPLGVQAGLMLAVAYGLYALLWRDWGAFSLAIDQRRWVFNDFRFHFYPMAEEIFETRRPSDGFYYSAFFAVVLRPFAWMPLDTAARLWGAMQVLLFAGLCLLPLRGLVRTSRNGTLLYLLLCATSYPALSNFKWGQVSVLLTLLTLGAFDTSARKRPILAGLMLAIAASIKYYSGFFILWFLFRRDWRACGSFAAGSFVCFVAAPMLLLGPADWLEFHRAGFAALGDADWVAGDANSQYFAHVVLRWMNGFGGSGGEAPRALVAVGAIVAAGLAGAAWRLRKGDSASDAALAAALLLVSLPFLVSTSWPHYFVYLPFVQTVALGRALRPGEGGRLERTLMQGLVGVSILLAALPFFLLFPSWLAYQEKGFLFLSNVLVMPALLHGAFRERSDGSGLA